MPAAGADYVASKVNAIAANPDVFAKTVFILIYDENDGFFDHVVPPTAPAGTAGEYITVDNVSSPIGLGFRVPCVIVSPWTVGGYVCHDTFDHTSVTRLLEQVTGVTNPNISAWRRQTVATSPAPSAPPPTGASRGCPPPPPSSNWRRSGPSSSACRRFLARPSRSRSRAPAPSRSGAPRPPRRPAGA
jgi:phospholipase C